MFEVHPTPTASEVDMVVKRLRQEDKAEFAAWGVDPLNASAIVQSCELSWVAYSEGTPVFIFALRQQHTGSYGLVGFGVEGFESYGLALTKWGLKEWLPDVFYLHNIRRIEAVVPAGSVHSIRWLVRLGMTVDGSHKDFIRRGDRFVRLSYTITDFEEEYEDVPTTTTSDSSRGRPHEVEYGSAA